MFALILKLNKFREANGRFGRATSEHIFSRDMEKQYLWLDAKAKKLRMSSVDELVEKHPDKFVEFASLWRKKNPLPA